MTGSQIPQRDEPIAVTCARPGPMIQFGSVRGFEWNQFDLPVVGLSPALDGLRLLHLTDLHTRKKWDPAYDDLIAMVKNNPPDLILFTGDFVDSKRNHRPALPHVERLMGALTSRLGTFSILGNHDGDLLGPALEKLKVQPVDHRRVKIASEQGTIELIGLPGVERYDLDMAWVRSLGQKEPGTLRVALGHFPDLLPRTAMLQPDLYLAGHTHGGQVAIPSRRWPLIRHDSLPRRLCTGVHRHCGTVLVANRGFGFSSPLQLRFNCPAEVVEVTVRRG